MNVLLTILSMGLLFAGFVAMGYAFEIPGLELVLFVLGLVLVTVAILLPIEIGYRGRRAASTD